MVEKSRGLHRGLYGYISKRPPYDRASERRDLLKELNGGSNGQIRHDGLTFVEADKSDIISFRVKQIAWDRDAAGLKLDDLDGHNAT